MSNLVEFENVGLIELRVSDRAKRMKLGVKSDGLPFLVIPNHGIASKTAIMHFVNSNIDWIKQQQQKQQSKQTIFTPNTTFHTHQRKLSISINKDVTKGTGALLNNEIRITLPIGSNIESPRVQKFIRTVIEESMRDEAKQILPLLTKNLAKQHGLQCQQVSIKKAKTRWGSCSSKKNINLNLHLMRLPQPLINYVILHELAHTVELNHSAKFWNLLERICPGSKKLDKELNLYNTEIY
ncbi:MAG: M48 family metallopeptidase [Mangrovibacterium sp.]